MASTVVSSPGKVLLAGGYLVLEPAYSGLVVSTSSRFYTVIRAPPVAPVEGEIHARSPQFLDAEWVYNVRLSNRNALVEQAPNAPTNKFVHLALQCVLTLAIEVRDVAAINDVLSKGVDIVILGDNDFYSQRAQLQALGLPRTLDSIHQLPPFTRTGIALSQVHKTGLGSSAALITSLVSALLLHFSVVSRADFADPRGGARQLAHNVAQYVHCFAQDKVGSGFDVSAAAFGSQVYTRFDPAVIRDVLDLERIQGGPLLPIVTPSNKGWNYEVQPFKLPPLTRLMLADVDAGSDTPSFVGKVLKWRQDHASEAHSLWTTLDQWNQTLALTFSRLCELESKDSENYRDAVKYISTLQPLQWLANPFIFPEEVPIVTAFYEVHQITETIREHMRKMGEAASVPIEPPEQTKLLDVCVTQAGVIGGGIPGAGGYDAIWLLVTDPVDCVEQERPIRRIEYVWTTWKDMVVTPLTARESMTAGTMSLEGLDQVPGLEAALS